MREENSGKRSWIKYLVTVVVGAGLVVLICGLKGAFRATEPREVVRIVSDGFTLVGILLVCVGFLTVLNKAGAFDGLGYSFHSMARVFRNYRNDDKTTKTYYDYKKAADKKRKRQWFLVIVGAGFLVIAIVLVLVFVSMT